MVQPKKPPISIRLGDERLARIDSYAKKHALSRHLALLVLIDAGLRGDRPVLPPPEAHAAKAEAQRREAPPPKPAPFQSRLKGEWKAP